ncbi:unnamed protein product [Musa acuminata subsp. burmannicoides]
MPRRATVESTRGAPPHAKSEFVPRRYLVRPIPEARDDDRTKSGITRQRSFLQESGHPRAASVSTRESSSSVRRRAANHPGDGETRLSIDGARIGTPRNTDQPPSREGPADLGIQLSRPKTPDIDPWIRPC